MFGEGTGRLDTAAQELYLRILGRGGSLDAAGTSDPTDPDDSTDPTDPDAVDSAALKRLEALGLLAVRPETGAHTAVNPRSVSERISTELRAEGTRLLVQAEELPALLDDLAKAYENESHRKSPSQDVQHVEGREAISERLARIEADCREEILAAQPGAARTADFLAAFLGRIRRFAGAGGSIRVLYAHGVLADRATAEYVGRATALGARFRTLDEPFQRLHIYDRRTAVIPAPGGPGDHWAAAFIEDPATVEFLLGVFERDWSRAARPTHPAEDTAAHDHIGRLLAQGLTQRAVASRLGLSERTVAGHIARLRELYDAETLFQLGWQMRGEHDA
ncbi:LuxR family transcriptional regulator [Kitasatospora sp. NPDC057500]|uniref:LuxR family transcriptional regulator n=1 Tax=Kitasatospora sp. NPDC057500 TaxID=3346151 RepID=UPI00368E0A90